MDYQEWIKLSPEEKWEFEINHEKEKRPHYIEFDYIPLALNRHKEKFEKYWGQRGKNSSEELRELNQLTAFRNFLFKRFGLKHEFRNPPWYLDTFVAYQKNKPGIGFERLMQYLNWYDKPEIGKVGWLFSNISNPKKCIQGVWELSERITDISARRFFLDRIIAHTHGNLHVKPQIKGYGHEVVEICEGINGLIKEYGISQTVALKKARGRARFEKWIPKILKPMEHIEALQDRLERFEKIKTECEEGLYRLEQSFQAYGANPETFKDYEHLEEYKLSLDWVKIQVKNLNDIILEPNSSEENQTEILSNYLISLAQIALFYRYLKLADLHQGITKNNAQIILIGFPFNSGQKLESKWQKFEDAGHRTEKSKYGLRDFQAVEKALRSSPKYSAALPFFEPEFRTLKSKYS